MSSPKFSILMPVVKTRYFKEAFESALSQSFSDYEIVVLDNKADADVSWVAQYPKVRLITNPHQLPPTQNWNNGVSACSGDYVILLSDDDLLEKDCLLLAAELLKSTPALIIRVMRRNIDDYGHELGFSCPGKTVESASEYIYNQYTFNRGQVISDIIFSRTAALSLGGFKNLPKAWGADHYFAIEMAFVENKILSINVPLVRYRISAHSISGAGSLASDIDKLKADKLWITWTLALLEHDSSGYASFARDVMRQQLQRMQDAHYIMAARHRGFWGVLKIHQQDKPKLASTRRSIARALAFRFSKLLNLTPQ